MKHSFFFLLVSLLVCGPALVQADESVEARLRESLRATMLQLREAQTQAGTLQAEKVALTSQLNETSSRLESLTKQSSEQQRILREEVTALQSKVAQRDREIGQLRLTLGKWKAAHAEVVEVAKKTEVARAKLRQEAILLQRRVEDQQRKNLEMHALGTEILERYRQFGLGEALLRREPFVQNTKVKFQNLIQDYGDQLSAAKIDPAAKPEEGPDSVAAPITTAP